MEAGRNMGCWWTAYETEDVFAQVPPMAERIDPVLKELDWWLEDANCQDLHPHTAKVIVTNRA
jgi:hypothetical protein